MTRQDEWTAIGNTLARIATERRDERVAMLGGSGTIGLVAYETSGTRSDIIRISLDEVATIALDAVNHVRGGQPATGEVDALAGAISDALWNRDYVAESRQRADLTGAPLVDDVRAIQARRAAHAALTHLRSTR
ncbi:hypothetical protein [Curtobacterium oceanosedimentum]|uniref:hypothetical protein n=1 Tax=Curtobacterium oceanosedimentum TaxID=465820 RepID=UPI003394D0B0